jgi:hypothetical protein
LVLLHELEKSAARSKKRMECLGFFRVLAPSWLILVGKHPPQRHERKKMNMMVPKGGLEPPRVAPPPPQDGVSASSTTSALGRCRVGRGSREIEGYRRPASNYCFFVSFGGSAGLSGGFSPGFVDPGACPCGAASFCLRSISSCFFLISSGVGGGVSV